MMDVLAGLTQAFALLLSPPVLAACGIGLLAGLVIGFLPGISPLGGLALAYLLVLGLVGILGPSSPAVLMVAVAYGTLYGRAFAAINLVDRVNGGAPATSDRPALLGGLIAGLAAALAAGVVAAAGRLHLTLFMGPVEFAAAFTFVLLAGVAFGSGSTASALAMVIVGLLLGLIGQDIETGAARLTFDLPFLSEGLGALEVGIGLFVIANVIHSYRQAGADRRQGVTPERAFQSVSRGMLLAVPAALLPTNGRSASTSVDDRRTPPLPDPFDPASQKGVREIVSALMASDVRFSLSLIPLMIYIAPPDVVGALLQKVFSSQETITGTIQNQATVWLLCATLIVAHVVPLVTLVLPGLTRWWPRPIDVRIAAPAIVVCALVGSYLIDQSLASLGIMLGFGVLGYLMMLGNFDRSLLFLGFLFATGLEENVRRGLMIARGDAMIFLERPISAGFLIAGVLVLIAVRTWRHKRRTWRHKRRT
jgi:putative tricarboxylic transport membrane protein